MTKSRKLTIRLSEVDINRIKEVKKFYNDHCIRFNVSDLVRDVLTTYPQVIE